jgi:phosphate starvation-inducible protein PhoH and related proteins
MRGATFMPLPKEAEMFYGLGPTLTDEQKEYLDAIFDYQLTICNAKAGTGKTTLAVGCAYILYKLEGKPLLYVFNPTEEWRMGFRPGEQREKESAYLGPLKDALKVIGEKPELAIYNEENPEFIRRQSWVTAMSHTFMRGTNIRNMTLIIDEVQNFTKNDLRKVLTRVHDDSKVILIGHTGQIDLPKPELSGFAPYIEHFRGKDYVKVCELTVNFRGRLANDADSIE